YIVIEPGQVMIDGRAADEEERESLIAALIERAGAHVALDLSIRTPARVISPFAFSASRSAGAGIRLERCAARSYEEQALLRTVLDRAGIEHPPNACPVGLGGPGGDWPEAISAGITALATLPAGRIDIEYRDARLFAEAPTSDIDFETALAAFAEALPEGFTGKGEIRADDAETRARLARERYWMQIRRGADDITIAGLVPDEQARTAIETEANALYGTDHVNSSLSVTGMAAPKGWRAAAMRLLALLRGVRDGEAELAGDRAFLRGTIEQPVEARALHDRALAGLPDQIVSTALRINLPAQHAAMKLPPPRCAADLNAANVPSIEFAPGSAVIDKSSNATLDRMAAILQRCAGTPIEIGGHTDSQGREELNLRLSQARADAVWRALVERGVEPDRILAHGFGAEIPVATNDTAAGRARNRRIAFEPAG
ncbi:MAG TPA: OmpA family protein, partial [Paracoccaceae bacterium]|nr:OmpA family protein [Paracoccaceae bacterium]